MEITDEWIESGARALAKRDAVFAGSDQFNDHHVNDARLILAAVAPLIEAQARGEAFKDATEVAERVIRDNLRAELAQACAATIEEAADVAAVGGSREIRLPDCLKEYRLLAPGPYVARSANDKLDDWPFWYVCGPSGENTLSFPGGQIFSDKEGAEAIARHANQRSAALTSEPRSAPHREAS